MVSIPRLRFQSHPLFHVMSQTSYLPSRPLGPLTMPAPMLDSFANSEQRIQRSLRSAHGVSVSRDLGTVE